MKSDIFSSSFVDRVGFLEVDQDGDWGVDADHKNGFPIPTNGSPFEEESVVANESESIDSEKALVDELARTLAAADVSEYAFPIVPLAANTSLSKVGLKQLPRQREHMARIKGGKFNMMVAGRVGSGKTTFFNSLFKSELDAVKSPEPTTAISVKKYQIYEESVKLDVTCIDTPGFGNSLDSRYCWMALTRFIDSQFEIYLHQREQPDRSCTSDDRVHCCIYFISTNGDCSLSPLDLESMKALSKRVNLLPVISKADQYTNEEVNRLKQEVRECIVREEISICDFVEDHMVKKSILNTAPYAIIGANHEAKAADGTNMLARKYSWGCIEVENRSHCDFAALRDVLITKNMLDLILSTEANYDRFRRSHLTDRLERAISVQSDLLENHGDNGLVQLVMYNKTKPDPIGHTVEQSDLFKAQQLELEREFSLRIQVQEQSFRDWKRQLMEKQAQLNGDLENWHFQLMKLQQQVKRLEDEDALFEHSVAARQIRDASRFTEPGSSSPLLSVSSDDERVDV